ncbi:IclR family transcriptional regulator [Amycolatopsis taiwanensis]|uniref:IclR family transcriptional regulator n=1 Tax=Amycolatopsis taiwanensis TaxID=342230 RepID=UPI000487DE95|nr:IclR family transcriptional regulator [Amycolatopsis taiwanensis]
MTTSVPAARQCRTTPPPPSMLDRMTLIMDCFYGRAVRLSIEDVARATRLPRSTTHRILVDLVRLGWLAQTPSGYCIGSRALSFGNDGGHGRLREATAASLHDLALRTGMVAHLAVLADADICYLDKVGGHFAAKVPSWVGGRAPAHSTALGKAMLAWLPPEHVDLQVGGAMTRQVNRSGRRLETLHQELARIRGRNGLAFERDECFPSVAAAIRSAEGPVAGISLCGKVDAQLERVAPLVARAAKEASIELFGERRAIRPRHYRPAPELPETWSPEAMNSLLAVGSGGNWM